MASYGVREICDVVFKTKINRKIGNKIFYKNEPVIYFDTLKTSTLEGAVTTVYAEGGRGNSRLVSWDGDRQVTFTMEDALISPTGFMILAGAGLLEAKAESSTGAGDGVTINVHTTEKTTASVDSGGAVTITLSEAPLFSSTDNMIYVMVLDNDEIVTEPYIPSKVEGKTITIKSDDDTGKFRDGSPVLVDYYVAKNSGVIQIDITNELKGGNFYIEASTLFRDTDGMDHPAEFIIPNARVQSNFTFTMASTGDPSTFTFTMDAFPDYTRFDPTKKVLAALQVIEESSNDAITTRDRTASARVEDPHSGMIVDGTSSG